MAFEKIGLGGVLRFNETQALTGMRRASRGFARLQAGARQVGAGFNQIGAGVRNASLALAPMAIGLGLGIKKAADFEKQMSAVGAITRANEKDFGILTAEAKRLGVESVFSAQQSAEAMEFLGRAGFNTTEIVQGLGGVMNAAAAEGVDLATSADIVARVVKSMGEEISDAAHVADILVLTSAKSNTNIIDLGESFKYGAAQAKVMGISTEETAAVFGKMADAGLRGSVGGTSFMNMLNKLAKPSAKARKMMTKWGISLTDATGKLRPMPNIIEQFKRRLDGIPDAAERAGLMSEIFGIRGAKAYSALALAGGKALGELTADLQASSFGVGAAAEAAERRLDNFLGALTLFGSSVEATSIEFFGPMLDAFKVATQDMTGGLNSILFSIQGIKQANDSFNQAAGVQARARAKEYATQLGLVDKLGARQAATAQAGLAAITRSMVGEEKLTRAQRASRAQGFATFIEQGLTREKMSRDQRQDERDRLKRLVEQAKAQGLSAKQEKALQKRFLQSLAAQKSGLKKIGGMRQEIAANEMQTMLEREAQRAKLDAEARGMLEREKKLAEVEAKHGRTARLIAEGVLDAIKAIKDGFNTAIEQVKAFGERMRESIGEDNLRRFTKIGVIATVVAGALAPVAMAITGIGFVLKSVLLPQIMGVAKIIAGLTKIAIGLASGALWPLVGVLAVLGAAFLLFRNEGETVGETLSRAWGLVKQAALDAWNVGIKPFIDGFTKTIFPIIDGLKTKVVALFDDLKARALELVGTWAELFGGIASYFGLEVLGMSSTWQSFGEGVATVFGFIADAALEAVGLLAKAWLFYQQTIASVFLFAWENVVKPFFDGFVEMFVPILDSLETQFVAVWDTISAQFGVVVETFTTLWDELAGSFGSSTEGMSTTWADFGGHVANVVGFLLETTLGFVSAVVQGFLWLTNTLAPILILPFTTLWNEGQRVFSGILDILRGNFWGGVTKIFTGLANVMLLPFRIAVKGILEIAKALPESLVSKVVSKEALADLKKFADVGIGKAPTPKPAPVVETAAEEARAKIPTRRRRRRGRRRPGGMFEMPPGLAPGAEPRRPDLTKIGEAMAPKKLSEARTVEQVLEIQGKKATPENVQLAQAILAQSAKMRKEEQQDRRKAAKAADRKIENQINLKDERSTTIKNRMCVDGREVATATAHHKQTIFERSGGVTEPYLRRQRAEQGVAVAGDSKGAA